MAYPYTALTFAAAKQQLANRLDDPSKVFWSDAELGVYLIESLQTWQAYSATWKDRVEATLPLPHAVGQAFYDLKDVATDLCDRLVTDRDLITALCYELLEPPVDWTATPAVWAGTEMFTLDDLTNAIQRRRDQFLLETGTVLGVRTVPVPPAPIGRVSLPEAVADVRRAAWVTPEGVVTVLWRSDIGAFNSFAFGWSTNPETPAAYSQVTSLPVQLQLSPVPSDIGTLSMLTVDSGAVLAPQTAPTVLNVPQDFAWVVKFGALADLLSREGQGRDVDRATYCQSRWTDGLRLARLSSTVLNGELNGVPMPSPLPSVFSMDVFDPTWQSRTPGVPSDLALAGMNIVAVSPIPNGSGPYSMVLDVVRNMPVPYWDVDIIQVGAEFLDVVFDYAQHLAAFKEGGAEFQATVPQYQRLVEAAQLQNERLRNWTFLGGSLGDASKAEGRMRPMRDQPEPAAVAMVGSEGA